MGKFVAGMDVFLQRLRESECRDDFCHELVRDQINGKLQADLVRELTVMRASSLPTSKTLKTFVKSLLNKASSFAVQVGLTHSLRNRSNHALWDWPTARCGNPRVVYWSDFTSITACL